MTRSLVHLLGALAAFVTASAGAQNYPTKPVRIIVPFSAGSGSDVLARTLGPKFAESWGQQVVVENREGAGGLIGAQVVAKAPAFESARRDQREPRLGGAGQSDDGGVGGGDWPAMRLHSGWVSSRLQVRLRT